MVFSSFNFLFVFLPALLVVYYLIPKRLRSVRNGVLLAFSLFFYACGGPKFLPLILASIGVNWLGGLLAAPGKKHARLFLVLTMAVNLALLGWFKYAMFAAENLAALGLPIAVPEIVLPIGISFFTFQGMSYVIDVYRGDAPVMKNPLYVALYIALFPQLVAGPIVRYTTVAEEIRCRRESVEEFAAGAQRFIFGLAKKLILANGVGELADMVFSMAPAELSAATAWLGAIAYTGQIYFDFSAYSDMAIGLGRMLGFHFLENFNYPYIAKSITDFWRRWHMSLSSWFRDYVYIPLGGNRRGIARQIINLLVVWGLTGFWHGAEWNFLLWGLYFALLLIGERFVWKNLLDHAPAALRHVYTMLLVIFSWVLFRAEGAEYALDYLAAMFRFDNLFDGQALYCLAQYGWVLLISIFAALPIRPVLEKRLAGRPIARWAPRLGALALFAVCYLCLVTSTFNPFIYFRF